VFQGDSSHLPLKLNTAGVIPPIFASSFAVADHGGEFQRGQGRTG
jgi:preprotein translocase subunit SecY